MSAIKRQKKISAACLISLLGLTALSIFCYFGLEVWTHLSPLQDMIGGILAFVSGLALMMLASAIKRHKTYSSLRAAAEAVTVLVMVLWYIVVAFLALLGMTYFTSFLPLAISLTVLLGIMYFLFYVLSPRTSSYVYNPSPRLHDSYGTPL